MIELLSDPQTYIGIITLTFLEIVLGIDNLLFISIIVNRVKPDKQELARRIGLSLALGGRLLLLFTISYFLKLNKPWFSIFTFSFSMRDLIFISGGIFLVYKSTKEIFLHTEKPDSKMKKGTTSSFASAIFSIFIIDMVFSIDSVITALGLSGEIIIMTIAIIISMIVMLVFSRKISSFIDQHPSLKILGLSFLTMVGVLLIADGFGHHIPKGYIYFSLIFSLSVEAINLKKEKEL